MPFFRSSVSFCQVVQCCVYSLCRSQPLENHYLVIKQTCLEVVHLSRHNNLFKNNFIVAIDIWIILRGNVMFILEIFCTSNSFRLRHTFFGSVPALWSLFIPQIVYSMNAYVFVHHDTTANYLALLGPYLIFLVMCFWGSFLLGCAVEHIILPCCVFCCIYMKRRNLCPFTILFPYRLQEVFFVLVPCVSIHPLSLPLSLAGLWWDWCLSPSPMVILYLIMCRGMTLHMVLLFKKPSNAGGRIRFRKKSWPKSSQVIEKDWLPIIKNTRWQLLPKSVAQHIKFRGGSYFFK